MTIFSLIREPKVRALAKETEIQDLQREISILESVLKKLNELVKESAVPQADTKTADSPRTDL